MLGQPASVPRWEPKTSRIGNRCVTHSTMSFGVKYVCISFIIQFPDHLIWYLPSQLLGVLSRLQSIINSEYRDSIARAYYKKVNLNDMGSFKLYTPHTTFLVFLHFPYPQCKAVRPKHIIEVTWHDMTWQVIHTNPICAKLISEICVLFCATYAQVCQT